MDIFTASLVTYRQLPGVFGTSDIEKPRGPHAGKRSSKLKSSDIYVDFLKRMQLVLPFSRLCLSSLDAV